MAPWPHMKLLLLHLWSSQMNWWGDWTVWKWLLSTSWANEWWIPEKWWISSNFFWMLDVKQCEAIGRIKEHMRKTKIKNMSSLTCFMLHFRTTSFSPSCRLIAWRFHTLPRATERLSVNKGGQCHKDLFVSNRSQINKWKIRWSWNILKHSLQIFASNTVIPNEATKTCQPWYFMTIFSKLRHDGHSKTTPSRQSVCLRSWQLGIFPSSILDGHLRVGPQPGCLERSVFVSFVSKSFVKHWNYIWNFSIVFLALWNL